MQILSDPTGILILAGLISAFSGIPTLLYKTIKSQRISAVVALISAITGEYAVFSLVSGRSGELYELYWKLPFDAAFLKADILSALFLFPLFIISALAMFYSISYWPASKKNSASKLTFFMGLFTSSMVFLLLVSNSVLFLFFWEIMALSAYFLLTTEQQDEEVQRVGTVYLFATHGGTMALFVMFSLLKKLSGSFVFPSLHSLNATGFEISLILILCLIGFGGKAGVMPLHFWLPGAHANAPSHVSAMMSGVMLKMGIYGMLRTFGFFDTLPAWLGWVVLILGGWSAINGIALASIQKDMKRTLACSSIENIGIIMLGLGIGFTALHNGSSTIAMLGFFGAMFHIINHSLFKSLLFLLSGILIHGTNTRDIDRLGGLAKRMPYTSRLFLLGSVAISGLPPMNGFIGEFFLYCAAARDGITSLTPFTALAAPLLAVVGGIAVITFIKLYGIMFLGSPRSSFSEHSHEGDFIMIFPAILLAAGCIFIGLFPSVIASPLTPVAAYLATGTLQAASSVLATIPLDVISGINLSLIVMAVIIFFIYRSRVASLPLKHSSTWGCGYLEPTPRMQYTGTSFSELPLTLFGVIALPLRNRPFSRKILPSSYPSFKYKVREMVLDSLFTPAFYWTGFAFSYLRKLQHGKLHVYILYIFVTLFVLMLAGH